ncbi:unnamed protein product [Meganyctiphanes norvegica]|uniref:Uncharacterized protein n=1 Tax=Meganyctiphanes norvegica TaxID=48144 RepID=A0AAV2S2B3_MEGNR
MKMFKSKNKPDLPARPKPPTWEQMEEDLISSTKKDIIFTIRNKKDSEANSLNGSISEDEKFPKEEEISPEQLFKYASLFVENNDELNSNLQILTEKQNLLKDVSEHLRETVENVKKQALVAIDGH